jgi:adenylate cyclase
MGMQWLGSAYRRILSFAGRADLPTRMAGVMLVLLLAMLQVWDPPLVEAARLRVFDQLQRWSPRPVPAQSPTVIIDIDDASLAELGQWPWPRTVFADLIDALARYKPRAIAFDVLFAEADRLSPPNLAPLVEPVDSATAQILRHMPSSEESMAGAMAEVPVILGEAGATTPYRRLSQGVEPPARVAWLGEGLEQAIPRFPYGITALPSLAAAAKGLALVSITPEIDGVVRRAPTVADVEGRILPGFFIEAIRVALGQDTIIANGVDRTIRSVSVGSVRVPTDIDGRAWIHYTPRRSELYISAREILAGNVPAERITDHIVLIGSSAVSLSDLRVTPIAGNTPGVEVQAQLIESALSDELLRRPARLIGAEQAFVLIGGLLLVWFGTRMPASLFPPLVTLVIALAVVIAWVGFRIADLLIDTAYPAFAIGLSLFWLSMAKYIIEETKRRNLRHAFGHYLSPVMVDRLVSNPSALALNGEKKTLTVAFSDIRSFTTLTETYADDPEALTRLLNRYFTAMTAVVLRRDGTIDKYIGDAMMAFWNAPLDDPQHSLNACLAALAMVRRLDELNTELEAEFSASGLPFSPIRTGFGIETGECFVGNLGSAQRFNYSVIGDSVNVASRLESSSKSYAFPIIVGERVQASCPHLAFLELDRVQLRGKQRASRVFALVGDDAVSGDARWPELVSCHQALARALRTGVEGDAKSQLESCRALAGALGLSDMLAAFIGSVEKRLVAAPAEPELQVHS